MLKELMPSLPEILNISYNDVRTFETDSIIQRSLLGIKSKENPMLLQIAPALGCLTNDASMLSP